MINIDKLIVTADFKIKEALSQLEENHHGVLLLIDDQGRLIRVITDGDIRRLFLDGFELNDTLSALAKTEPKFITESETTLNAFNLMEKYELDHIPVLDGQGKPVRLIHRRELTSTILLSTPHIGEDEQKYVQEAFSTNWVAPLGPNVDAFEKEMAEYLNVNAAVALSSGTAALHLALVLLNVQRDDVVFCSSFTFVASANVILYQGAKPVFIDSEFETWNMSPKALKTALEEARINNKLPKAVIVVNLYGQSANYNELLTICNYYNVPIVEDAAESLGAIYQGKASGTFGKFGVFSFNGNKIITTSGGGMLVSDDKNLIDRARFLATQARDPEPHYEHSVIGYNYRMSNILAGVGRGQLRVLEKRILARQNIYRLYKTKLEIYKAIIMMPEDSNGYSTHWLSTLILKPEYTKKNPMDVIRYLSQNKIEVRRAWKPMHRQPLFATSKYYTHSDGISVSDYLFDNGLCLPSGSNLTVNDINRVIQCLLESLEIKQTA